jgi:SWI/SNF-related matrix-associated actin-dependent regulator of chromatin subfamily A-like protein 1
MEIKLPFYELETINQLKELPIRKYNPEIGWTIPDILADKVISILRPKFPDMAQELQKEHEVRLQQQERILSLVSSPLLEELSPDAQKYVEEVCSKLSFPKGLSLYPFQKVGVAFSEITEGRNLNGDMMGNGKSIQILAYLNLHSEFNPVLIVCPGGLRGNWEKEIRKWLPERTIQIIITSKDNLDKSDIYIISYDLMYKFQAALVDKKPSILIADECHRLANIKARLTRSTLEVAKHVDRFIGLSGTPVRNRTIEFYNVLNHLRPDLFPNRSAYIRRYCGGDLKTIPVEKDAFGNVIKTRTFWQFEGPTNQKELTDILRNVMIRRLKREVLPDLPPKTRKVLPLKMPPKLRKMYTDVEAEVRQAVQAFKQYQKNPSMRYNPDYYSEVSRLRMAAIVKLNTLRQIVGRAKAEQIKDLLEDFFSAQEKVLIFGHHIDVLDTIAKDLPEYVRVDGKTPKKKVTEYVERFQEDPSCLAFLGSLKAAGEGLTLTAASNIVIVERAWTPADEEQGESRAERIGLKNPLTVYYPYIEGTVDERMNALIETKRVEIGELLGEIKDDTILDNIFDIFSKEEIS